MLLSLESDVAKLRRIFVKYGHYLWGSPYHAIENLLFFDKRLDSSHLIFPWNDTRSTRAKGSFANDDRTPSPCRFSARGLRTSGTLSPTPRKRSTAKQTFAVHHYLRLSPPINSVLVACPSHHLTNSFAWSIAHRST
jgi:hypothetical protein